MLIDWHWLVIWLYFALLTVQSWQQIHGEKYCLAKIVHVVFSIIQPIALMVSVVYWVLLSDEAFNPKYSLFLRWRSALQHILNIVFTFLDLFTSNTVITLKDSLYPTFFVSVYLVFGFVWFVQRAEWPYSFLNSVVGTELGNLKWGLFAAFVIVLLVAVVLFHLVVMGLVKVRDSFGTKTINNLEIC